MVKKIKIESGADINLCFLELANAIDQFNPEL
jgi:hypothetical protein